MNRQRRRLLTAGACVALCLLLSGCGQRGDLFFPKDKPAASQPLQQN